MSAFNSIPVLDLSLARDPNTKPAFLIELRRVLLEVGFLYLKNVGIEDAMFEKVKSEGKAFFDLPKEEKLKIEMKNAPSFLGYSKLGNEVTADAIDHREQIDLSTTHPLKRPDQPLYMNILGPNQWPSSTFLPTFRQTFEDYMKRLGEISIFFTSLIAEAIGLPAGAFSAYFDKDQQHKLKIIKYPDLQELGLEGEGQGVGPHKDYMFSTFLLQASEHRGLQVQNREGEWIDCPPINGTLVVNIGQGLEAVTQGVCVSTIHRALSPTPGTGPRFSIPFFQGVSLNAEFKDMAVPESVLELRKEIARTSGKRGDDVVFDLKKGKYRHLGEAILMNRIKSHPDVGERWYPELLKEIKE
ncbi:uncharacterized protein Z519_07748 [Cladophialophora bantiana CBS 173.52]|uniref:Fe2OG dioxygenase domain-containing protein n=1 Tax=Cladophialophora bantiana (strain ATCC 10958 / CBS 173.52 / CDC B-1940 / NIH 8579) TaxID=1442370 RepID=A0A0D2HES3_CLAB1|nr:uncharacterized protein Z519_07748 [Cladophialophora bantiana CBS 173.52]KIW91778.1 hypothetical protein Z519_07748 [Cladophialophora bantiana CBS 173.52]